MSQRIKFITDSTCDLPKEMLAELDIDWLPLHVFLGDDEYLDGVNIGRQDLFDYANQNNRLPRTAAATMLEFTTQFKQALDAGYDAVIYTGLSSQLSATFQSAILAKAEIEIELGYGEGKVFCVDSKQLSTGEAQLLLEGKRMADSGLDAADVAKSMDSLTGRLCSSFIVDTLQYLHMGGRCSSVQLVASNMLKIHPQISLVDGKMVVGDKFRGSMPHVLKSYQEKMVLSKLQQIDPRRIFITQTCIDQNVPLQAKRELEALNYFEEIIITQAGATISSHCGPDTLGYLYILKS